MFLERTERWIQGIGKTAVIITLTTLLLGLWRGLHHPISHKSEQEPALLRQPTFYLLVSLGYFGVCYELWRPLRLVLSLPVRTLLLILGTLLYFSGLALVMCGRLALGQMYNVSSVRGASLYADQQLVTHGPFAWVRHPMYLGILFTGVGGVLLYRTWTFVFLVMLFPGLVVRAHQEEQALTAAFGEQWQAYCQQVPGWIPVWRCR